ncbi:MAG: protein translocase subunit SecF [Christensenellales bacterium]
MKKLYGSSITDKWRIWIIVPFAVMLIAIIVFGGVAISQKDFSKGMNIGIDFSGGSVITIVLGDSELGSDEGFNNHLDKISDVIKSEEIAAKTAEYAQSIGINLPSNAAIGSVSYSQKSDSGESMSIIVKYDNVSRTYDKDNSITNYRNELIKEELQGVYSDDNGYDSVKVDMNYIGATASSKLIRTALLSLFITLALILIYIIIRFEIWSGLAAIIAIAHDVLMMVCLTIIFRVQVNSAFIAAMITIVAYSINNTIVVFDRVRENMKNEKTLSKSAVLNNNAIVDKSIWDTFSRSVNTTVTTMISIVLFAILGASSVREFALPVIFGLIAGFYSSLVIAPSLYCLMKNAYDKSKVKKNKITAGKKQYAGM